MENIIRKIEKLLAVAEGKANENESIAAAAMAQKLMAKYNVDIADLNKEAPKQNINEEVFEGGRGKWRYTLAEIIARNFRCKMYILGGKNIVFVGYDIDSKIAMQTFKSLYKMGMTFAGRCYEEQRKAGKNTKGVLNTYYLGYLKGIKEVLDKQCQALMIVTPKEVEEKFKKIISGCKYKNCEMKYQGKNEIYQRGRRDGRSAMNQRSIEA